MQPTLNRNNYTYLSSLLCGVDTAILIFNPVASEDYSSISQVLTFRACDRSECVSIRTVSDCIMEDNPDTFWVYLWRTEDLNQRINVSTEYKMVNIRDDEGM